MRSSRKGKRTCVATRFVQDGRDCTGGIPSTVRASETGILLKMLVGLFEENGLRITATALSGYMKKLNREAEEVSAIEVRKGRTQPSPPG